MTVATKINDAGTWRQPTSIKVNDAGTWRAIQSIKVNDSGTWRSVYTSAPSLTTTLTEGFLNASPAFIAYGYMQAIIGSMGSATISDGNTVSSFYYDSLSNTTSFQVAAPSDPGGSYFVSVTFNSVTRAIGSWTQGGYSAGVKLWYLTGDPFGLLSAGTTAFVLV